MPAGHSTSTTAPPAGCVRHCLAVETDELLAWLRQRCATYDFDVTAVYSRQGHHEWPLLAEDAADLERQLDRGGHLLPLPKESASLANLVEVSIVDYTLDALEELDGAEGRRGTERGYPDIEISGDRFGGGHHAVDVKVARRNKTGTATQSRITLYTGNSYFKYPQLKWPSTFRPFEEYASHLDMLVIYDLNTETRQRVENVEVIVHEAWRIASKQRSSTTREYIGAVQRLDDLRAGRGEFDSPEAFYQYWRRYPFNVTAQVARTLQRLLEQQGER